jgi:hypothetical protein
LCFPGQIQPLTLSGSIIPSWNSFLILRSKRRSMIS